MIFEPGSWRDCEVSVGHHVAPAAATLASFLSRWSTRYGSVKETDTALVTLAAAHHRLGWIHPFVDGNGRVMRLHTHLGLEALGLSDGLWSVQRGFGRAPDRYHALLAAADQPRRGDLDGRGNLSESALVQWIHYALDICLDELRFMANLLDPRAIEQRIAECLAFEEHTVRSGVRRAHLKPLHLLCVSGGEVEAAKLRRMIEQTDSAAGDVMSALVRRGLLTLDAASDGVQFGWPLHALRFYLPGLWPEAELGESPSSYLKASTN